MTPVIMDGFKPMTFLESLIGKSVMIELKWGQQYEGILNSYDKYMNIRLYNTFEYAELENIPIGDVLIRCNNITTISSIE